MSDLGWRSTVHSSVGVVGHDADDSAVGIEFHELGGLSATLVVEEQDDAGDPDQDVDEVKAEIGEGVETELEVAAQTDDPSDGAGLLLEEFSCGGRRKDDVRSVVGEDAVEIVGIPGGDPVAGELPGFESGGHIKLAPETKG